MSVAWCGSRSACTADSDVCSVATRNNEAVSTTSVYNTINTVRRSLFRFRFYIHTNTSTQSHESHVSIQHTHTHIYVIVYIYMYQHNTYVTHATIVFNSNILHLYANFICCSCNSTAVPWTLRVAIDRRPHYLSLLLCVLCVIVEQSHNHYSRLRSASLTVLSFFVLLSAHNTTPSYSSPTS